MGNYLFFLLSAYCDELNYLHQLVAVRNPLPRDFHSEEEGMKPSLFSNVILSSLDVDEDVVECTRVLNT